MRLFDAAQSTEALPGTWLTHSKGIEACVRALTGDEDKKINRQYGVRKVTGTKKGSVVDLDPDKIDRAILARADLALIDTRGAETRIVDQESAEIYSRLLGIAAKKDDMVKLDGHWTPELKRQVFKDAPDFAEWIAEKSQNLLETAAEDEEGKEGG